MTEVTALVHEGVDIETIDSAMKKFGMPVGPITLCDEVGIDVSNHVGAFMSKADLGARMHGGNRDYMAKVRRSALLTHAADPLLTPRRWWSAACWAASRAGASTCTPMTRRRAPRGTSTRRWAATHSPADTLALTLPFPPCFCACLLVRLSVCC